MRTPTGPPNRTPTAPRSTSAVVGEQPGRAPAAVAGGHAANERQSGKRTVDLLDETVDRERPGVDQQDRDRVTGFLLGHADDRHPGVRGHHFEREAAGVHAGQHGTPDGDRGRGLDTAPGPDHPWRRAADRGHRAGDAAGPKQRCARHLGVTTADERDGQIRPPALERGQGLRPRALGRDQQVGVDRQSVTESSHALSLHRGHKPAFGSPRSGRNVK